MARPGVAPQSTAVVSVGPGPRRRASPELGLTVQAWAISAAHVRAGASTAILLYQKYGVDLVSVAWTTQAPPGDVITAQSTCVIPGLRKHSVLMRHGQPGKTEPELCRPAGAHIACFPIPG